MNIVQWLFPSIFSCEENRDYNKDKIEFKTHKTITIDTPSQEYLHRWSSNYYNSYYTALNITTTIAKSN